MFGKGAPRCRRCAGAVYAAEEVIAAGSKFHIACYTCKDCKTRLSSTLLTEKEGEIYCSTCYAKNFGPKGYGIGSQSLTFTGVSVADGAGAKASPAPAASKPSYAQQAAAPAAATAAPAAGGAFCTGCGNRNGAEARFCGGCGKPTSGGASAASAAPAPASAPVSANFQPNKTIQRPGAMNVNTTSTKCGKCAQTVYDAEKVVGGGRVFHQQCFRCTGCKSGLNSTNINDKDGNIYCNSCYGKNFGPKGFGFAGGSATTFGSTN